MRVIMECPRCGRQNARTLQHCQACNEWLHGASAVVGVCPQCHLPVRESELACSNCGAYLDPRLEQEGGPRLPQEKRLGLRARKAMAEPGRAAARLISAAFLCRAVGAAVVVASLARGIVAVQELRVAATPDEAMFIAYAAVLWALAGIVGVGLLVAGFVILRPPR
ncbi:MAG TPA: zinc ribbon domain-containing protein [Armatimonadota bacterium]|nr:zinc ribbon domain-containing protein [Armatimonadota bacterium]